MLPTQFNAFFVFGLMLFFGGGGGGYHNLAKRRRLTKGWARCTLGGTVSLVICHTLSWWAFMHGKKCRHWKKIILRRRVFTIYPRSNITGQTVCYTAYYQGHGTRCNMPMRCALACAQHTCATPCKSSVHHSVYNLIQRLFWSIKDASRQPLKAPSFRSLNDACL